MSAVEERHPLRPQRQRLDAVVAEGPGPRLTGAKDTEIGKDRHRPSGLIPRLESVDEMDPSRLIGEA